MFNRPMRQCAGPVPYSIPLSGTPVCCPPPFRKKTSVGYCCPVVIPDSIAAQSESSRIASHIGSVFLTSAAGAPLCDGSGSEGGSGGPVQSVTTLTPGSPIPYTSVGTVAASLTVRQRAAQVVSASTNPYNPATRFSQYFPPAPIPYCPPVRYVRADTLPSVNVCQPIRRFTGIPDALVPPPAG